MPPRICRVTLLTLYAETCIKTQEDAMKMLRNAGKPYRRVQLQNQYDRALLGGADILQPTTSSIDFYWKCQTRAETSCLQQTNSLASHVKQCRAPIVSAAQRYSTILPSHVRVIRPSPSLSHPPAPTIPSLPLHAYMTSPLPVLTRALAPPFSHRSSSCLRVVELPPWRPARGNGR